MTEQVWTVDLMNADGYVYAQSFTSDGTEAVATARRWHQTRPGDVYLWTPKGSVWLIQDNGLTRVGF